MSTAAVDAGLHQPQALPSLTLAALLAETLLVTPRDVFAMRERLVDADLTPQARTVLRRLLTHPGIPEPQPCPLSYRQHQVLSLTADGKSYREIAAELRLSVSTIRTHLHAVYDLLGVHGRAAAVIHCYHQGWL